MNVNKFKKTVREISKYYPNIMVSDKDGCLLLQGELAQWDDIVKCGYLATKAESEGVINEIKLKDFCDPPMRISSINDKKYDGTKCDVLIIGGGIVGCAILREFSKYQINACLIEKENDVAIHASSRNDGCIHVGIDLSRKTLKHKYLRRAVKNYEQLARDLQVDFIRHGQTLVFTNKFAKIIMPFFLNVARKKGIVGTRLLRREELFQKEPNINRNAQFAVFFP